MVAVTGKEWIVLYFTGHGKKRYTTRGIDQAFPVKNRQHLVARQLPSDNIHTILFVSYPIQIILMTTTRPCQKAVRHAFSTISSCLVNDQDGTIVSCNVETGLDSGPRSSTLQEKKIFIITIPNCIFWDGWTSGVKSC